MNTPPLTNSVFDPDGIAKSSITAYGQDHQAATGTMLPAERIGAPPTPPKTGSRPSSTAFQQKAPPTPDATQPPTPIRTKDDASMDFPMPPKTAPVPKHRQAASMSQAQTRVGPPLRIAVPPATDSNFLTALAAQERKVLELKEELQKAEAELVRLKGQWASTESSRRRTEGQQLLHRMRPMSAVATNMPAKGDDEDGSSAWMYQQMQQRKSLIGNAKSSQRRVFQGSRKPRALSLLTPENLPNKAYPFSAPLETLDSRGPRDRNSSPVHAYTSPELAEHFAEDQPAAATSGSSDPRRLGRRMTTDFKTGLWTFFEDLRHATLGDEVRPTSSLHAQFDEQDSEDSTNVPPPNNPRPSAKQSPTRLGKHRSKRRESSKSKYDASPGELSREFWREHGFHDPKRGSRTSSPKNRAKDRTPRLHTRYYSVDDWETWDSPTSGGTPSRPGARTPQPKASPSPSPLNHHASDNLAPSNDVTPRQSVAQQKPLKESESIPWPALRIDTGHLRRTATSLMDDWERSLSAEGSERLAHFTN